MTEHIQQPATDNLSTDDKMHEACGIFGVWAPGEDVARLTYFGLYALQHRGRSSPASPPPTATTCDPHPHGPRLHRLRRGSRWAS